MKKEDILDLNKEIDEINKKKAYFDAMFERLEQEKIELTKEICEVLGVDSTTSIESLETLIEEELARLKVEFENKKEEVKNKKNDFTVLEKLLNDIKDC